LKEKKAMLKEDVHGYQMRERLVMWESLACTVASVIGGMNSFSVLVTVKRHGINASKYNSLHESLSPISSSLLTLREFHGLWVGVKH